MRQGNRTNNCCKRTKQMFGWLLFVLLFCCCLKSADAAEVEKSESEQNVSAEKLEEEIEKSDPIVYPEAVFEEKTQGGITVRAEAPEGVFPEGTTMKVSEVDDETALEIAQEAIEDAIVVDAAAVDIVFYYEGEEIQPVAQEQGDTVLVTLLLDEPLQGEAFTVVHQHAQDAPEISNEIKTINEDSAVCNAEAFSMYIMTGTTSGVDSGGTDRNFITVSKSFTGDIDASEIPAGFSLTISDGTETLNLPWSYEGTTQEWRVYVDNEGGNYTISESGAYPQELQDKYNFNSSGLGSVTISPAQIQTNTVARITAQNRKTFTLEGSYAFVASLTGSVGNGTLVITYSALSASERAAIEASVLPYLQGDFDTSKVYYYSIETQGNTFTLFGRTATYNASAGTITFSQTNMWNMIAGGNLEFVANSAAFNVVNNYTRKAVSLSVEKLVTGNMGDKEKSFRFTVIDQNGVPTNFSLKDGENKVIEDLNIGSTVYLMETNGSDYQVTVEYGAYDANGAFVGTEVAFSEEEDAYALTVEENYNVIRVTNHREIIPDTGISLDSTPYILLLLLLAALTGISLLAHRSRRI